MSKQELWRWGEPGGVVLHRETEDGGELLWINARLPRPQERPRYGRRLEVFFWLDGLAGLNAGLEILWDYFHPDSILATMRRRGDATRVLIYTAACERIADERYQCLRAVLRPTVIGLSVANEPAWESLTIAHASDEQRSIPTSR